MTKYEKLLADGACESIESRIGKDMVLKIRGVRWN